MTYQKDKGKEIQVKCLSVYNFLDTNDWGQHWTVALTRTALDSDPDEDSIGTGQT